MNRRSMFNTSRGSWRRQDSDELPVPKLSIASRTPRACRRRRSSSGSGLRGSISVASDTSSWKVDGRTPDVDTAWCDGVDHRLVAELLRREVHRHDQVGRASGAAPATPRHDDRSRRARRRRSPRPGRRPRRAGRTAGRAGRPSRRVVPPHERLEADDAACADVDGRLVVDRELAVLERMGQVTLQLRALRRARAPSPRRSAPRRHDRCAWPGTWRHPPDRAARSPRGHGARWRHRG